MFKKFVLVLLGALGLSACASPQSGMENHHG